jgi:predicted MFS family arabinose efflux permease
MKHDSVTMMLFGAGGVASSIIVGFCTDKFTLKKIGVIVLVFNALSCLTLYLAIYIKYFYTTILVYFFFGMALLGLFTWLAAVCCKKFEGKSDSFAAVLQLMVLSYSLYTAAILLFGNKVSNVTIRLCLELASLVLQSIGGIVFIVKINNDPINVDYSV